MKASDCYCPCLAIALSSSLPACASPTTRATVGLAYKPRARTRKGNDSRIIAPATAANQFRTAIAQTTGQSIFLRKYLTVEHRAIVGQATAIAQCAATLISLLIDTNAAVVSALARRRIHTFRKRKEPVERNNESRQVACLSSKAPCRAKMPSKQQYVSTHDCATTLCVVPVAGALCIAPVTTQLSPVAAICCRLGPAITNEAMCIGDWKRI